MADFGTVSGKPGYERAFAGASHAHDCYEGVLWTWQLVSVHRGAIGASL